MKTNVLKAFMLIMFVGVMSVFGLSACAGPRDGMAIEISSDQIIVDENGNRHITLTIEYDEQGNVVADSGQATLFARVINGDSSIDRTVEAVESSETQLFATTTYDTETQTNTVTIRAVSATAESDSSFVTIMSNEDNNVFERVYVEVVQKATSMDYADSLDVTTDASGDVINNLAVIKDVPFVFDTDSLFEFGTVGTESAVTPNIVYQIDLTGEIYQNGDSITIGSNQDVSQITITAFDQDDTSNTALQKTFVLDVLSNVSEDDVVINRTDTETLQADISSLTLLTSHTVSYNNATIEIVVAQNDEFDYSYEFVNSSQKIYLEVNSLYPAQNNVFTLQGIMSLPDVIEVNFIVSYAGILNSPEVVKTLAINVVDYPTEILINDTPQQYRRLTTLPALPEEYVGYYIAVNDDYVLVTDDNYSSLGIVAGYTVCYALQDFELVVFDAYEEEVNGEELVVDLGRFTMGYGEYTISVDVDNADTQTLTFAQNLLINGEAMLVDDTTGTIEYLAPTFTSGDTLVIRLKEGFVGSGSLSLIITPTSQADTDNLLTRNLLLQFTTGITDIVVSENQLSADGELLLEVSEGQTANSTRDISFTVLPDEASMAGAYGSYVSASSSDSSVVTVSEVTTNQGVGTFTVTAHSAGEAVITLTSQNGVTEEIYVSVIATLNTFTLSAEEDGSSSNTTSISYKDDAIDSSKQTVDTIVIEEGKAFNLIYGIYPSNATITDISYFIGSLDENGAIISTQTPISESDIINIQDFQRQNGHGSNDPNNHGTGVEYVVAVISFDGLSDDGTQIVTKQITQTFAVDVYIPIESLTANVTSFELLSGGVSGYYNQQQQEQEVELIASPDGTTVTTASAVWSMSAGASSYITVEAIDGFSEEENGVITGSKVLIRANNQIVGGSREVEVYATIQDRGRELSCTITVTVNPQILVSTLTIGNYDETNGFYFEETQGFSSLDQDAEGNELDRIATLNSTSQEDSAVSQVEYLNTRIQYSGSQIPTNSNLSYFLFDATVDQDGNWAVSDANRQYTSHSTSVWLGYDYAQSKYFVTPLASGYTILYIVPQDKLSNEESIVTYEELQGISNKLEVHITVADGYTTYYRLYDSEDILDLAGNSSAWDKNYYVMNDIEIRATSNWTPIGNSTQAFTGTITSFSDTASTIYGFNLNLAEGVLEDDNTYGIFGVFNGRLENVNIDITSLNINFPADLTEYYIGSLAGRVLSGAVIEDVIIRTRQVQLASSVLGIHANFYVGTIGLNESGNISKLSTDLTGVIESTNAETINLVMGGAIGLNRATFAEMSGLAISAETNITGAYENTFSSSSAFGGAIGRNESAISLVSANGSIILGESTLANALGGLVGVSTADISNSTSSVSLANAINVGGIVGIATAINLSNVTYEIYSTSRDIALSSALTDQTQNIYVGGLAGLINGSASIAYSYVISFDSDKVISSSQNLGGLVGGSAGSLNINNSFFSANIDAQTARNVGGLVGTASIGATISNTFVTGTITGATTSNAGLFVGTVGANSGIATSYSAMTANIQLGGVISGSVTYRNTIIMRYGTNWNEVSISGITYLNSTQMSTQSNFTGFDFTSTWAIADSATNSGHPILLNTDGSYLYPNIITSIVATANSGLESSNIFNTSSSTQVIIVLSDLANNQIRLADIFSFLVSPQQDISTVRVSVSAGTSSNAISIFGGSMLGNIYIEVLGVGVTSLTISSSTSSARCVVEIAVVNGFDDVYLYESIDKKQEADAAEDEDVQETFNITAGSSVNILTGTTEEWYADFIDANGDSLNGNNVGGGMMFLLEEGYITIGDDDFSERTYSIEQILNISLAFSGDEQTVFRILSGDNNATVTESAGTYTFNAFDSFWGEIDANGDFTAGTVTGERTVTRSQIISAMTRTVLGSSSGLMDNGLNEMNATELEERANSLLDVFARFFANSSVFTQTIDEQMHIVFCVDNKPYFTVSQREGTSTRFVVVTKVFMSVENDSYISVSGTNRHEQLEVTLIPYYVGVFSEVNYSLLFNKSLTFFVVCYDGIENVTTNVGGTEENPTEIELSQNLSFTVTMQSDSPYDEQAGSLITITDIDTGEIVAQKNILDDLSSELVVMDGYVFDVDNLTVSDGVITEQVLFGIDDNFKQQYKTAKTFEITVVNKMFVENGKQIERTFYVKINTQSVQSIDILHYADAELEGESQTTPGNYLTNAGAEPTNTIMAGEYGLLRINVFPNYADFDQITITSNVVENDVVSFVQRVAETISVNGANQTRYYYYEDGVTYIENGIIVAPVSNRDLTFDGNIYLQTLIAKQTTSAAGFIITVTISKDGMPDIVQEFNLAVDATANLIISYDATLNPESIEPEAYIAVGTGGSGETYASNRNEFTITQVGVFDVAPSVSIIDDETGGNVQIENVDGRYYIVVGNADIVGRHFTVSVSAVKYVNGYRRTISRAMNFTIVDYVLKDGSIVIDEAPNNSFSEPFADNANYKLTIRIDTTKINANTAISGVQTRINALQEDFNDGTINPWSLLDSSGNLISIEQGGTLGASYYYAVTNELSDPVYAAGTAPTGEQLSEYTVINNAFYLRLVVGSVNLDDNGWYICPVRQSSGNSIVLNAFSFLYTDSGLLTNELPSDASTYFTVPYQNISISFIQLSSTEEPIPINTLNELLEKMEAGQHYRLMQDIDASGILWTPLNVAISSLDGNGHTITIGRFATLTGTETSPANYGLFGTVSESTLLKNITVKYSVTTEDDGLDQTESTHLNFGGIAGINKGIIANCEVNSINNLNAVITISSLPLETNVFNVGGLVGKNNGDISNSRVEKISLTARGTVAGFVAVNNGAIASSYADNSIITNTSTTNTVGATAGFVGYNNANASITTSYAGGTYATLSTNEDGVSSLNVDTSVGLNGRTQQIVASVNTGGFLYSNAGSVTDCFAGVALSVEAQGSSSGGFMYENLTGGTVTRSYSVSSSPQNNYAHTPFVAPNSTYSALNTAEDDAFEDCFYYNSGYGQNGISLTEALGIEGRTIEQFVNDNNDSIGVWDAYSISRYSSGDRTSGEEFTSVWTFLNSNNVYFNYNNFKASTQAQGTTSRLLGPRLVSADMIAVESWDLVGYDFDQKAYVYTRGDVSINGTNHAVTDHLTIVNNDIIVSPHIITSAEDLYDAMTADADTQNDNGIIDDWYRLAADIDLTELVALGYDMTTINTATFAGNFEGNGFEISGIDISVRTGESAGLFATIDSLNSSTNNYASVQNLSLVVQELAASSVSKVGALAGTINNAVLGNISVSPDSNTVTIVGYNFVGGVAGKIMGTSRASNLTSSISVTAVFGNSATNSLVYNEDLMRFYGLEEEGYNNDENVLSYAGGIFGVVDLTPIIEDNFIISTDEYEESRLANLTVTGESKISGTTVGGVIGLLGTSSYVTNIKKLAENGSELKGSRYVGGIIGENHGYINFAQLLYTEEVQDRINSSQYVGSIDAEADFDLFVGTSKAIGGLIGINFGFTSDMQSGVMDNSQNRVAVKNSNAQIAGGLIGISVGGEITACFATASVRSATTGITGGAFGVIGGVENFSSDVQDPFEAISNKTAYEGMQYSSRFTIVSDIVALNNWSYSDYNILLNIQENGYLGGFVGVIYSERISEAHTSMTNEEYEEFVAEGVGISASKEDNFYVSTIYNSQPQKTSNTSDGAVISAVGGGSSTTNLSDVATGLTRYEMWTYSYENNSGNEDVNTQVDRMFENWPVYDYGVLMDEESETFKIINYDSYGVPFYNPQQNPNRIEIWTVQDFLDMEDLLDANYVLMADLDFTGVDYTPIGTSSRPFTGTFTGTHYDEATNTNITHVLYNITMSTDVTYNTPAVGIFGYTSGATIQDVVINNINFSWVPSVFNSTAAAGFLIGIAEDTEVLNVQIVEDHSRVDATITNNSFSMNGVTYTISGNSISGSDGSRATITENSFTLNNKHYRLDTARNEISQVWTGENVLRSSANAVGGLIGNYSLKRQSSANLQNSFIEADIELAQVTDQRVAIDYQGGSGQFVIAGSTYTIDSQNNVSDSSGFRIGNASSPLRIGEYICVKESGENYMLVSAASLPESSAGGFIGYVETNTNNVLSIIGSYFQGNITSYRDSQLNLGGFAGKTANTTYNENFVDATINISYISNLLSAGGFAGTLINSNVNNATAHGDFNITVDSNTMDIYIGGFVGRATGRITNAVTYENINFNTTQNWTATASGTDTQMVAGFAGSLGTNMDSIELINIASLSTIKNNTLMVNTDGFSFETPTISDINGTFATNVYFDEYLALAGDINNFSRQSWDFILGNGEVVYNYVDASDAFSVLSIGNNKYPRVNTNTGLVTARYQEKFDSIFTNALSGSKINPIQVSTVEEFNSMTAVVGNWYIQSNNLSNIPLHQTKTMSGFYNGAGYTITAQRYDYIYGSEQSLIDMGVFTAVGDKGVVSGVNVDSVIYLGLLATDEGRTNIGFIASVVNEGGIVFGSASTGQITIVSSQQTSNIIGGLVAVNDGQVFSCASSVDITVNTTGTGEYFAVGGMAGYTEGGHSYYSYRDSYYSGSIINNITSSSQALVGGITGMVVGATSTTVQGASLSTFFMRNTYSAASITGNGGMLVGDIMATQEFVVNVYYVDKIKNPVQAKTIANFGIGFNITNQRNNTQNITSGFEYSTGSYSTPMTEGLWSNTVNYNFGLPHLRTETNLVDTGIGTPEKPYLLNSEGQLAWALNNGGTANVNYYSLTRNLDYGILTNIDSLITSVTFNGYLLGNGYYISNSTGVLVGANRGTITQVGFDGTITASVLVTNNNSGVVSEIYTTRSGNSGIIASGTGSVVDCLTYNYAIDKNGVARTKTSVQYATTLNDENFDYISTWVLQPTSSSATAALTTGMQNLRVFVNSLENVDITGITGTADDTLTQNAEGFNEYTLHITTKEQYAAILQYIIRSGMNGESYIINLEADLDITGLKMGDLGDGKDITISINGNDHTIYNVILDNNASSSYAGIIGEWYSGTISNIKFNQMNLMTTTTGGIVAGRNNGGVISDITITNSIVGSAVESAVVGGIAGYNSGTIENVSMSDITLIANGGTVGGVAGNSSGIITISSLDLEVLQGTTPLTAVGAVAGITEGTGNSITVAGNVNFFIDSPVNIGGGIVGRASSGGEITINKGATVTFANAGGTSIGGIVGNISGSEAISVYILGQSTLTTTSSTNVGSIIGLIDGQAETTIYIEQGNLALSVSDSENVGGVVGFSQTSSLTIRTQESTDFTADITITSLGGNENVGGVIGRNTNTVTGFTNTGSINISVTDTDVSTGGFVGHNSGTIEVNVSNVTITGNASYVGGITGFNTSNATIRETTSNNINITAIDYVGGIAGYNDAEIYQVTVSNLTISANSYVGGIAGLNDGDIGRDGEDYRIQLNNMSLSALNRVGAITSINNNTVMNVMISDQSGAITVTYQGGLDSEESGAGFMMSVNNGYISGITATFTSTGTKLVLDSAITHNIGVITGVNANSITASSVTGFTLALNSNVTDSGLIGLNFSNSLVGGVTSSNFVITGGSENLGLLVGLNQGTVSDSFVNNSQNTTWNLSGVTGAGAVGKNESVISGLTISNNLVITGNGQSVGAVVGINEGTIGGINAVSSVSISGDSDIGGFVGHNSGTITIANNASATVTSVTVSGNTNIGGFFGYNEGSFRGNGEDNVSQSNVSGASNVGGFVGYNASNSSITNEGITDANVSGGTVSASAVGDVRLGGLVGYNTSIITTSTVYGTNVTSLVGEDYASITGGFAGENASGASITSPTVTFSSTSNIIAGDYVGGIAGRNGGSISSATVSIDSGIVTTSKTIESAGDYVGGIAGINTGTISGTTTVATGNVFDAYGIMGGIAGENSGTITGTVRTGANLDMHIVSGTGSSGDRRHYIFGGVVGRNTGSISASITISSTNINGGIILGGVVGLNDGGSLPSSASGVTFANDLTITFYGAILTTSGDNQYLVFNSSRPWFSALSSITSGQLYAVSYGKIIGCQVSGSTGAAYSTASRVTFALQGNTTNIVDPAAIGNYGP